MVSEKKHIKKVIQAANWPKQDQKRNIELPTNITELILLSLQ